MESFVKKKTKTNQEHPCAVCGKPTTNKVVCSEECRKKRLQTHNSKPTLKLTGLDGNNYCAQCHKIMPPDRYSMYCEECELLVEY